jgi:hypothetical protein
VEPISANKSRHFFTSIVRPTVDEFLSDITDIRRGCLAAIVLYHVADYWDHENNQTKKSLERLRQSLIKKYPEFAIIRDVADASKHAQLRQFKHNSRELSSSDQIKRAPGLFEAPFGVSVFNEASEVVVTLDDGTSRPFAPVVQSVLSMWENELR